MRLENKSGGVGRDEEQREAWRAETHKDAGGKGAAEVRQGNHLKAPSHGSTALRNQHQIS